MPEYNLTNAQKEILRKTAELLESGEVRGPLLERGTMDGSQRGYELVTLDGRHVIKAIGGSMGDMDALVEAGLVSVRVTTTGSRRYVVKQAGFDAVNSDFSAEVELVSAGPGHERPQTQTKAKEYLPSELVGNCKKYVLRVVRELNDSYEAGCPNACAVMIRRLVEILIVDSFRSQDRLQDIKRDPRPLPHVKPSDPPTAREMRLFAEEECGLFIRATRDAGVSVGVLQYPVEYDPHTCWGLVTEKCAEMPEKLIKAGSEILEAWDEATFGRRVSARRLKAAREGIVHTVQFLAKAFPESGVMSPTESRLMGLAELINEYKKASKEGYWVVEKPAKQGLLRIKSLGDRAAHGKYARVTRPELERIQTLVSAVVQQLVETAYPDRS